MNDVNISLRDFVYVWNGNDDAFIENPDGTFTINVTTMSANKFAMLLRSMFATDFDFKITSDYQLLATPTGEGEIVNKPAVTEPGDKFKPGYEEPFTVPYNNESKIEKDLGKLAERIDNDFVEIQVDEDHLEIKGSDKALETLAKVIEKIDETYLIEVHTKKLIVK